MQILSQKISFWRFFISICLLSLPLNYGLSGKVRAESLPNSNRPNPVLISANPQTNLEPKAIEILKAMSDRLAVAKTMKFTAVTTYENPSRLGPALAYHTLSNVTLQRPNKLQVLSPGDGPASEFYYNGKTLLAFAPTEDLVAIAEAPGTIDEALKFAYETAAIYFPFTDFLVANPYGDIAGDLKTAFYIGQSQVIDGTTTDMVAIATDNVFAQVWIGAEDKLPRMIRAVYRNDPSRLRHQVTFNNWQLDMPIPTDTFGSTRANAAKPIPFKRPEPEPIE
ncbi:DUF2092 domain-containing protein [Synechocystis salina]|uniref:DUF2092 domain-containing protein n=1 Tax=Synechocystis salina LEGE 00031 TaxID=1828736 RepID=A0ABR9VP72_9SYNC|nr:DUF2092 domain-containing protein [Synechocystis salina]MBE9239980.1 DUF2092 domain-containing protein [Synechocystis salina LEGE 00041]MBE9253137.1 DUF2092 domain-containing protein [Synechocystis salina LEGE 00031]